MRCCTVLRALGKQVRSAPQQRVVGTVFGAGGHRSCGVLVGVFWCVTAPGSGKGEPKYIAGHTKRETKGTLDLSPGCGICSWVAAWGTRRLGVEAPDGKGVPSGLLGLSLQASRSEGQGQHAWLK